MKKTLIHSQDHLRVINQDDIIFCKSDNCYTNVNLINGERLLISKSLARFTIDLNSFQFIRVNQSYLVNLNYIKSIDKKRKTIELTNLEQIPFTTSIRELVDCISMAFHKHDIP